MLSSQELPLQDQLQQNSLQESTYVENKVISKVQRAIKTDSSGVWDWDIKEQFSLSRRTPINLVRLNVLGRKEIKDHTTNYVFYVISGFGITECASQTMDWTEVKSGELSLLLSLLWSCFFSLREI